MPVIQHEATIQTPITRLWAFFTDPVANLPKISPPADAVVIESADLPLRQGSKLVIAARDPFGRRIRWHSEIGDFSPPHPVVFGMEARFVDIQLSGPFKSWVHEHEFEAIDSKTTRLVDRITYTPPMGWLGAVADILYLRWKIRGMMKFRAKELNRLFGE